MGYITQLLSQAKPLGLEGLGTFLLVLIGTSALVTLNLSGEATTAAFMLVTLVAFSLAYGWLIYVFYRHTSGYFNPAVTILLWLQRSISISWMASLLLVQLTGAILASIAVALLYGPPAVEVGLGAVYPSTTMGPVAAVIAELLGTACVLVGITRLSSSNGSNAKQGLLVSVGMVIGQLLSIGVSGGALNPVRAIAPQLAAANLHDWWVYWVGPIAAAVIVWIGQRWLQLPEVSPSVRQISGLPSGQKQSEQNQLKLKAEAARAALRQQQAETQPVKKNETEEYQQPSQANATEIPDSTSLQPTFQPEDEEQVTPPPSAPKRTPLPAPSAIRFVDFDQPSAGQSEEEA